MTSTPLDNCWKQIGVFGDKSCPRLAKHAHCRNCEAHAEAAIRMLERFSVTRQDGAVPEEAAPDCEPPARAAGELCSTLLFRLGEDWYGLPTQSLLEVMPRKPVHTLPNSRNRALLGLCNVHGALVACLSLGALLGGSSTGAGNDAMGEACTRMLVLCGKGGPLVAPVDEVGDIHALPLSAIRAPGSSGHGSPFTLGVLNWASRSITVLDGERLRAAIAKSLS